MTHYSLYGIVRSGNAYKAALMLQLCGADWEAIWVDFFNGEHHTDKYLAINSKGEIPVLIDHKNGDAAINQTGVILQYLADEFDLYNGRTALDKRDIMSWILWDNHKFTGNISALRILDTFLDKKGSPESEYMRERSMAAINTLERHLDNRQWMVADYPTIADISIAGYLFWPQHFGVEWSKFPNIDTWLNRIKSLKNWKAPEDILPSGPK